MGVFWDIENCQVPPDKSAFALANKIRKRFFEGKREAEFMCVCDINKERKEVMDDLNKAQVCVCMNDMYMFDYALCVFCIHICAFVSESWYVCIHVLCLELKRVKLLSFDKVH